MQLDTLNGSDALESGDIARFLIDNPGFFEQHPQLLPRLDIPHPSGGAVSLIERQVIALRSRCNELESRLHSLITVAQDNEQLHHRLHALVQDVVSARTLNEVLKITAKGLKVHFRADSVRFVLVNPVAADASKSKAAESGAARKSGRKPRALKGLSRFVPAEDSGLVLFAECLEHGGTVCGPLSEGQLALVFGADEQSIASAATIPLMHEGTLGLMVLGSQSDQRFSPGMGVLFLNQLGEVLSRRIRALR